MSSTIDQNLSMSAGNLDGMMALTASATQSRYSSRAMEHAAVTCAMPPYHHKNLVPGSFQRKCTLAEQAPKFVIIESPVWGSQMRCEQDKYLCTKGRDLQHKHTETQTFKRQ